MPIYSVSLTTRHTNMTEPFLISDDRLRALSATRQGRVSIAGYNYQAAYAVARLASMAIRLPVLGLDDWPNRLRYDWGEDLDEAQHDGTVRFTQCKRVATIGQPATLAEVVVGFAPKWLWVQESERNRLRFRLVCSDPRFARGGTSLDSLKIDVREHFLTRLTKTTSSQSDRGAWIADADAVGPDVLFEGLWRSLDCIYLPAEVVDSEPAGPRLAAEKEALRVLLERGQIDSSSQTQVLGRLRRLIHDNLITFDPVNKSQLPLIDRSPRRLDRADVNAAIDPWRPATQRRPPFLLVDRTFLSEQRQLEREEFVARQPDWRDVVHGHDDVIKFIERDQTGELETAAVEKVVARVGRGGKLPTLFVVGAPGDGKTTILRRVAARLVDAGQLLIADTGVGLTEPPGEPDEYVQAIERLQNFGRPVVLLLDDPLYAESPWLDVLRKLNRPGLQTGVLAASPQFLLDEHKSQLRMCDLETFQMARTSQTERESLAALYGRSVSSKPEEDFLVVAMEAAADEPFPKIIARLWLTLADGRDFSSARNLSDLPWSMRAYLFVCFFSRAYEACPEPLLLKLLEMTGGVPGTSDVRTELQRMKYFAGWRIFRIGQRAESVKRFQGAPITAAHTLIARQAWEQRPLAWCDVGDAIIEASVSVPDTIYVVSSLGVGLETQSFAGSMSGADKNFARKLIERWRDEPGVDTHRICGLVSTFSMLGSARLVQPMRDELLRRATACSQGWLAALQLWRLRNDIEKQQGFPAEINLLSTIQSADFSVAPRRASEFGQRLERNKLLRDAFVAQLLGALDGKLAWKLDSLLLTYLLTIAPHEQLSSRILQIRSWLEANPNTTDVRTKYLSFLLQLPAEFSDLRADAARRTAKWLEDHDQDTSVRAQYLSFLLQLPSKFSDLRADAARQTAKWLEDHDQNASVRAPYLSFLPQLPAEFSELRADAAQQTAKWLEDHDQNASVRAQYLSFLPQLPAQFSDLRTDAARQTAKWLEDHDQDTSVRTQYLSFLLQLPAEFSDLRADAARQTAKWLEDHDQDTSVRTQYLSFLLQLPAEFSDLRADAARQTAEWLAEHGEDTNVRTQYLSFLIQLPAEFSDLRADAARQIATWLKEHGEEMTVRTQYLTFLSQMKPVGEWQQLARAALAGTIDLIIRSGYQKRHDTLVRASPSLHIALFKSLKLVDSEEVRETLTASHDVIAEWCVQNPSTRVEYDLPLPNVGFRTMNSSNPHQPQH